ncbi:MAG: hypothetical protein K1X51_01485 [Rhodospirillaceae bacterium]|nr:hypothetical protein [Rhodospirillaceae bacterium]
MNYVRIRTAILLTGLGLMATTPVMAGIYSDDMSKCLVKSSSIQDQLTLVQWIYGAMSLHPAVLPMSAIKPEQRDVMDQKTAELMQRLLLVDCKKETMDAVKYEGPGAMQAAFSVLGSVAMRGLMAEPEVAKGLQGLERYMDKSKLEELGKELGAPPKK